MQQRIDRLRNEILRLRTLAASCDEDFRAQFRALADEMQGVVDDMQERLNAMQHDPTDSADSRLANPH